VAADTSVAAMESIAAAAIARVARAVEDAAAAAAAPVSTEEKEQEGPASAPSRPSVRPGGGEGGHRSLQGSGFAVPFVSWCLHSPLEL